VRQAAATKLNNEYLEFKGVRYPRQSEILQAEFKIRQF
jgi:hypothetical protein